MATEPRRPTPGAVARLSMRMSDAVAAALRFGSRDEALRATLVVLAAGAMLALLLGQDANWDLRNYHLYNAHAAVQGRVALDLAPAQLQSYFVPVLDVPYYAMVRALPAPVAGMALGMLHALVLLPLLLIATRTLADASQRQRLAPLLAVAGLASPAFLSEFGGTMGDASTAPFVLGAFALVLPDAAGRWHGRWLAGAGVLLGTAVACKLTNAIYAIALATALMAAPMPWWHRLRSTLVVASSALLIFAVLAGPWLWRVHATYGNPLLPQFNRWFQSPLAPPLAVADQRWLPQGVVEAVLRPILFTLDPHLVSEVALPQIVWPLLLVATCAAVLAGLVRRLRGRALAAGTVTAGAAQRMLVVFFLVGYLLWLGLFSIHRYLVVLELLAPLLLWWLAHRIFRAPRAAHAAGLAVAACAAVALLGWNDWGRAGWAHEAFRVQAPPLEAPATATVLVVGSEPQAWRIPYLPDEAAYIGLGTAFPETPAYAEEVARRLEARGGSIYAMVPALHDRKLDSIARRNRWAARLGIDGGRCPLLHRLADAKRGLLVIDGTDSADGRCRLALAPERMLDVVGGDAALRAQADGIVRRYGLTLDEAACVRLDSWIGADPHPWQWCGVVRADSTSPGHNGP